MTTPRALDLVLAAGATLRMTRFITTDTLGGWWVEAPLKRWAGKYEAEEFTRRVQNERGAPRRGDGGVWEPGNHTWMLRDGRTVDDPFEFIAQDWDETEPHTWQAKLVSVIDCPHCISFHLSYVFIFGTWVTSQNWCPPLLRWGWRGLLAALTLSSVVGHLSARIDH